MLHGNIRISFNLDIVMGSHGLKKIVSYMVI